MSQPTVEPLREVKWSECLLTDQTTPEKMQDLVGADVMIMGEPGVVESIELLEGEPPWHGHSTEVRPVYLVRWRLR